MNWLDSPVWIAFSHALLHFLWEGALIAALLGLMLLALRRAPAQARYGAACAAMLAMAASFAVTALGPSPDSGRVRVPLLLSIAPIDAVTMAVNIPDRDGGRLRRWVVAAWLLGVMALLVRRGGGWLAMRRTRRTGCVPPDHRWAARVAELSGQLGLRRAVALVESGIAEAPSVIGVIRPVILLPAGFLMGLPAAQAEAILLHELAHVRRHDYLVNLLQTLVEDLLFYHPAVWWVGRVIRRERENCCDDVVVAEGGDRRQYARTLASLAGLRAGEPAMAASGGSLVGRIRRLVRTPEGPRASATPLVAAMVLICAGAAALPAWQKAEPAASPDPPPAPQQQTPPPARKTGPAQEREERLRASLETPYRKWVNEDVAYIIDDRERAAFQSLTTDEEREHFIEQFWQRRDPTPATVENEFKEEQYRRIAYANAHFAADVPGWKTDQGRIYIMYGPPDEKETHPSGERGGPPYEEWMYYKLEGIGERVIVRFVDEQRNGRYRMTSDPNPRKAELVPPVIGPPARRVQEVAAKPPVQPNGDYLYASNGASVRVAPDGAALISVPASEVQVTLNRVTRHDGGGELVLQESARVPGEGYVKLMTLQPGEYRLRANITGPTREEEMGLRKDETERAALMSELNEMRRSYQDSHPRVLEVRRLLRQLELALTTAKAQAENHAPAEIRFRVP